MQGGRRLHCDTLAKRVKAPHAQQPTGDRVARVKGVTARSGGAGSLGRGCRRRGLIDNGTTPVDNMGRRARRTGGRGRVVDVWGRIGGRWGLVATRRGFAVGGRRLLAGRRRAAGQRPKAESHQTASKQDRTNHQAPFHVADAGAKALYCNPPAGRRQEAKGPAHRQAEGAGVPPVAAAQLAHGDNRSYLTGR